MIQVIVLILFFVFLEKDNTHLWISQLVLMISMVFQILIIYPFLPLGKKSTNPITSDSKISIISSNVLQKNNNYQKLIDLVEKIQPDILLTMETNKDWEKALECIEEHYPYRYKVPKENRYGMHFYSKIEVKNVVEHYFISDERPCLEIQLEVNNNLFNLIGLHPPPPSPTEKPTSKQKDAELVKIAKLIRELKEPCIVLGDFNNVCWSRSAKLFAKVSNLEDARKGRGIHGTFPSLPALFRFPLDLIFHSKEINIIEIKTLANIGSDHFPILSCVTIPANSTNETNKLDTELKSKMDSIINQGEKAVKVEN